MSRKDVSTVDLGNDFGREKRGFRLQPISAANRKAQVRMIDQRCIDRYVEEGVLSHEEWEVCEYFHRLAFVAGWTGGGQSHLAKMVSGTTGAGDPDGAMTARVDAAKKLEAEIKTMKKELGEVVTLVFCMICIADRPANSAARFAGKRKTDGIKFLKKACLRYLELNPKKSNQ